MTAAERRERKKRKLKERFDNEYDLKGDDQFYEEWKSEAEGQARVREHIMSCLGRRADSGGQGPFYKQWLAEGWINA